MRKAILPVIIFSFLAGIAVGFVYKPQPITSGDVRAASNLFDLSFDDPEIDSMLGGLEDNRSAFQSLHDTTLANSIWPALQFNPFPADFQVQRLQYPVQFGKAPKVKRPENMDDLAFYSVRELAELIHDKKLTSVELTTFCLNRLKKYDPELHCVITLTEDLAMEQARTADREIQQGRYRGILHGIPFGAKDLLAVPGYPTTWGAKPYETQHFDSTATVVKRLEDAGAVLVAKLSMGALAWGDVWFGAKTRNPWNTEQGSSGSSAGSASAVSAGLVPFAIGTETLGSIVSPSTVCGVTGLRPSYGRVSRSGAMALSWSMDKIGPICRTVEDCAIVFNAIYGPDNRDPSVVNAAFNYNTNADVKKFKIGYVPRDFERSYAFHQNDSIFLAQVKSLGFELVPIELPEIPAIRFILNVEAATAFDALTRSNQDDLLVRQIRNAWPNVFRTSRFVPAVEYLQANRLRTGLINELYERMKGIDLYLSPSWFGRNLTLTNLTGNPSVVMPTGLKEGLPTSITMTGQLLGEDKLLLFARYIQDHTNYHMNHPPKFLN
ncbi:MAG: amidase [Saprospiraceae bacterium]|nr:amidase [Saprospiraceae bacterium]MCB9319064.1 amidase [Lewinellaceae bacterium]